MAVEGFFGVGDDAEGDGVVDADDTRVDIDVDDLRLRRGDGVRARGELGEARAEREQNIRLQQPRADTGRRAEAHAAEEERVIVREGVVAAEAGDHRDARRLREAHEVVRRARPQDAAPGEDDGPLGGEEQFDSAARHRRRSARGGARQRACGSDRA